MRTVQRRYTGIFFGGLRLGEAAGCLLHIIINIVIIIIITVIIIIIT